MENANFIETYRTRTPVKTSPVLRMPELTKFIGRSRSSIYAAMDANGPHYDPNFPKPIRLSASRSGRGAVGWLQHEVEEYLQVCIERTRRGDVILEGVSA